MYTYLQLRMRASSATVLLFIGMLPGMMYRRMPRHMPVEVRGFLFI